MSSESRFDRSRSPSFALTFASMRFDRLIDMTLCRDPDRPMPPNDGKRSTVVNRVESAGRHRARAGSGSRAGNVYERIGLKTWRIEVTGPMPPCDVPYSVSEAPAPAPHVAPADGDLPVTSRS